MNIPSPLRALCAVMLLFGLVACSSETAQDHVARANQFLADSKYDSAIIELKNALQIDKQSAEARWLLGKIYLDLGDILSAEKELQRASRLGWSRDDVAPALAQSLLAQGKFSAVEQLESEGLAPQAEAALVSSKAMAAMAQGENRKAKKLLEHALERDPSSGDALLAKARILASQGDLEGADEVLARLLKLEPENGMGWEVLGDIRMGQQNLEEAEAAYSRAIEYQRSGYGSLFKRALLYLGQANYEAAQADTDELLAVSPQHPRANYIQGLLLFQKEDYEAAVSALSLAEPVSDQFPLVLFFLGSAQLIEGNVDQAAVNAVRFNTMVPESIRGRVLLATIRLQQGKLKDVQELLSPVLEQNPNDIGALNLMANALLRDGKIDEGITLLARVAELQPDSPVAQVRLGAGLLMGGKSDDATAHMESALKLAPEFQQADILLVMNHLQKKDFAAAIEAAEAYKKRHLTSVTPYNLLGRVYLEAGQPDKARQSFEKALGFDKGDPAANHNLAQMAIADGDPGAARQYYNTILAEHENFLPALIQLAFLDARENNGEALVAHLEQAMKAHPRELQPRLLLARYQLGTGRPDKVAPLFADLEDIQQRSPQVLQLMALAQLSENENDEARYTLEQLMESTPDTPALHLMMARAAIGSGDIRGGKRELGKALDLDENYLPARIALARLNLNDEDMEEFKRNLSKLVELAPASADVILLQAAELGLAGKHSEALAYAERAYESAPTQATMLALASYRERAGEGEGARQLYLDWLGENPGDIAVRMALAESQFKAGQADAAVVQYEKVLEGDPDNVAALNNAAWHMREKNPGKALEYGRRAVELAPGSADVLDTLAMAELANKNYVPAQRNIERALDKRPKDLTLQYHRAKILTAAGNTSTAIEVLEGVLKGDPDFPELKEAEALLDELQN